MLRSATLLIGLGFGVEASAHPIAPQVFCDQYPDSPRCIAGTPACTFCHLGTPPTRNLYGTALEGEILPGAPRPLSSADFMGALPTALMAVEAGDADGDGYTNGDEIVGGTLPADDLSFPDPTGCGGGAVNPNPDWDLCNYDPRYVFKKLRIDFCGQSPTYDEVRAFMAEADKPAALHRELDRCVDSEFWIGKNGQLWKLAHRKIRPIKAIKQGEDAGPIPLADYYDDYSLFVYTQIDDHDARDALLADYFVSRRTNPTSYVIAGPSDPTGEQNVQQNRRNGLITTRWYLILNVMFTALPRTAAAQAYRGFLGVDIAKLQGINSIDGEPRDYDDKGVTADACKVCHATLDPLSYPFKNYQGLTGDIATYQPTRIEDDFRNDGANITMMPESGYVLGMPVADLNEWAEVAANSNEFAAATVMDYWKLLLGHEPTSSEIAEFTALWQDLRTTHQYSVERMLHDLIETEAYGVP
jgi:hypothetical protein